MSWGRSPIHRDTPKRRSPLFGCGNDQSIEGRLSGSIHRLGSDFQPFIMNDLEMVDQPLGGWSPVVAWLRKIEAIKATEMVPRRVKSVPRRSFRLYCPFLRSASTS